MRTRTAPTRDEVLAAKVSLVPCMLALLLPAFCVAKSHNWIGGTIVQISQGYSTTRTTGFSYVDYTVQIQNRVYVLRSNPTTLSQILPSFNLGSDQYSAGVPVSLGEQVKVAIEGNRGWILDWRMKTHSCNVVSQTIIAAEPAPAAPQPAAATQSQRSVPATRGDQPTASTRPTVRREDDQERAGPLPTARLEPPERPTVRRVDDEPQATGTQTAAVISRSPSRQAAEATPPVTPRPPIPGVSAPTLLSKVEPRYTEEARLAGIEGTVVLYGEVGPDGRAHNFRLLRTLGYGLDERAIESVTAWRFRPGEKDGKPVTVAPTFEVNFRILQEAVSKELAAQSAEYIQKQLHKWRAEDAEAELGHPTAGRVATDQHEAAYGEVLTYLDPTNRYQKFDLTFDTVNKTLREIRVYPWNVTLEQCKAIWGDKFEVQQRPDGLRVYIYQYQRISVLARENGQVVSFDIW